MKKLDLTLAITTLGLFILSYCLLAENNKKNSKYPYIVEAYDIDHRSTAYTFQNSADRHGCISTTKGTICGTFKIVQNTFYKGE